MIRSRQPCCVMMMMHQCAACNFIFLHDIMLLSSHFIRSTKPRHHPLQLLIYGRNDWVDRCTCIIPFNSETLLLDFVRIGPLWLGLSVVHNSSVRAQSMIMLTTLLHSAVSLVPFTELSVKFIDHSRCGDSRSNGTFTIVGVILILIFLGCATKKWEWEGLWVPLLLMPELGLGECLAGF